MHVTVPLRSLRTLPWVRNVVIEMECSKLLQRYTIAPGRFHFQHMLGCSVPSLVGVWFSSLGVWFPTVSFKQPGGACDYTYKDEESGDLCFCLFMAEMLCLAAVY